MGDKLHPCFTPLVKKSGSVRTWIRLIWTVIEVHATDQGDLLAPKANTLELGVQQLPTNRVIGFCQVTEHYGNGPILTFSWPNGHQNKEHTIGRRPFLSKAIVDQTIEPFPLSNCIHTLMEELSDETLTGNRDCEWAIVFDLHGGSSIRVIFPVCRDDKSWQNKI